MPRYIQSKIRYDGATGSTYKFYAEDMDMTREIVRDQIPKLSTMSNAEALVIQAENNDETPILLLRGKDW